MIKIGGRRVREEAAEGTGGAEAFADSLAKQIAAMMYRVAGTCQEGENSHGKAQGIAGADSCRPSC